MTECATAMTTAHLVMDICLWVVAFGWFVGFLARHPGPVRRNRPLPAPSISCDRHADWRNTLPSMARRQGD